MSGKINATCSGYRFLKLNQIEASRDLFLQRIVRRTDRFGVAELKPANNVEQTLSGHRQVPEMKKPPEALRTRWLNPKKPNENNLLLFNDDTNIHSASSDQGALSLGQQKLSVKSGKSSLNPAGDFGSNPKLLFTAGFPAGLTQDRPIKKTTGSITLPAVNPKKPNENNLLLFM